jgi:multidrug efflux system outer membrane protein
LLNLLGGAGGVWQIGASVLQPVYNAGRNRSTLEAARAQFNAAVAEYQKAALNAYREVANALVTIQRLAAVRVERQSAVTVLQDQADLARDRYNAGVATSLEILIADQQLFQQQLLLSQTLAAELRARADLYRALGGGWQQ